MMSLRYNDFIAILTKAMQEQQGIIDNQDEIIKDLIKRMEQLEVNNKQ